MGAGCVRAAHVQAERGTAATGVAHGVAAAAGAFAFLLSTAGSMLVLVAEPLMLFVQQQALEGVNSAANDVLPIDVWCITVHTAPVLTAAAEDPGVSHTHQAVTALVALAVA